MNRGTIALLPLPPWLRLRLLPNLFVLNNMCRLKFAILLVYAHTKQFNCFFFYVKLHLNKYRENVHLC